MKDLEELRRELHGYIDSKFNEFKKEETVKFEIGKWYTHMFENFTFQVTNIDNAKTYVSRWIILPYIEKGSRYEKECRPATETEILHAIWDGVEYAESLVFNGVIIKGGIFPIDKIQISKSVNAYEDSFIKIKDGLWYNINHFKPSTKEAFEKQQCWKPELKEDYYYLLIPITCITDDQAYWSADKIDNARYRTGIIFKKEHIEEEKQLLAEYLQSRQVARYNRRTDGKEINQNNQK